MPLRRSHAKSHHGCAQCKERRIKCDETRPSCGACRKKDLACTFSSYHSEDTRLQNCVPDSPGQNHGISVGLPLTELELLHHWHTATAISLAENEALSGVLQTLVPRRGLTHPFLMHGILAISALHLSQEISGPRRQKYTEIAIQHHSLALSLCAPFLSNVTPENCHALFACSLLIASFSFASQGLVVRSRPIDVNDVTKLFKLVRGTASIVEKSRPWIEQGDLSLLLKFTRCAQRTPRSKRVYEVHAHLEALIEHNAEESHPQLQSDEHAVVLRSSKHLLDVFDSCMASENQSTILAWPAIIDPEYLDLTLQKDPRCLVTLAHYGAVLHIMIKAWWMEGWGKLLINIAVENLAHSFQSSISWPVAIINGDESG